MVCERVLQFSASRCMPAMLTSASYLFCLKESSLFPGKLFAQHSIHFTSIGIQQYSRIPPLFTRTPSSFLVIIIYSSLSLIDEKFLIRVFTAFWRTDCSHSRSSWQHASPSSDAPSSSLVGSLGEVLGLILTSFFVIKC